MEWGERPAKLHLARFKTLCYSSGEREMNSILTDALLPGIVLILLRKLVPKCDFSLDIPYSIFL